MSHITGESNKDDAKEKREWPPRSVSNTEKSPLVLPSLSSRSIPPALVTQSSSNGSELGTTNSWKKDLSSPTADEPEVPLTAKALNASQRQSKAEPNSFLENWRKDIPPAQVEPEPEAPITATLQTEPQVDATTPIPTSAQKFNTPSTPRTSSIAKATTRMSATRTPAKTPPSSSAKALAVSSKAPAKTPLKSPAPKQPVTPSIAQTLKPQHTGQSVASSATTRRPVAKAPATPVNKTPSRAEAASRAKTPTSARPKTPSTGLFAPTAASLARSRNAAPQLPTPSKKATISSSSMDRLSKPTAASKARIAAAAPVSTPRSGGATTPRQSTSGKAKATPSSSPSKAKKAPEPKPAATGAAVAASVAGIGLIATAASADGNDKVVEEILDSIDNEDVHEPAEVVSETSEEVGGEHQVEEPQSEPREESRSVGSEEMETTPGSPSPALETPEADEGEDVDHHSVAEDKVLQTTSESHEVRDELEDIVNLLESTSITKPLHEDTIAPTDIPDEIFEIPDEQGK